MSNETEQAKTHEEREADACFRMGRDTTEHALAELELAYYKGPTWRVAFALRLVRKAARVLRGEVAE